MIALLSGHTGGKLLWQKIIRTKHPKIPVKVPQILRTLLKTMQQVLKILFQKAVHAKAKLTKILIPANIKK